MKKRQLGMKLAKGKWNEMKRLKTVVALALSLVLALGCGGGTIR